MWLEKSFFGGSGEPAAVHGDRNMNKKQNNNKTYIHVYEYLHFGGRSQAPWLCSSPKHAGCHERPHFVVAPHLLSNEPLKGAKPMYTLALIIRPLKPTPLVEVYPCSRYNRGLQNKR